MATQMLPQTNDDNVDDATQERVPCLPGRRHEWMTGTDRDAGREWDSERYRWVQVRPPRSYPSGWYKGTGRFTCRHCQASVIVKSKRFTPSRAGLFTLSKKEREALAARPVVLRLAPGVSTLDNGKGETLLIPRPNTFGQHCRVKAVHLSDLEASSLIPLGFRAGGAE